MKITILLDEQFPFGMASANRIHLYAKGLTELGNEVVVFVPRATEKPGRLRNSAVDGEYEGVKFRYAYECVIRKSFIGRRFQNAVSLMKSFFFIIGFSPDIIMIAARNPKYIFLGKICSFLTKAKLVREKSEVPFYRKEELSALQVFRIKSEFRLFDGMIVISDALKEFFRSDLKLNIRMLEVPILADCGSGRNIGIHPVLPRLVYTGSLLDHKDGVLTIIRAFARIRNKYPHLKLVMTGNLDASINKEAILSLIDSMNLKDSVEFPGYLSREKLKELTSSALALLLAKPENRQNRYNMATKAGEYLMTGRPAVISSVDPICRYLKHRENVCITNPDDKLMAEEIEFLLDHPAEACSIGLAGRESVRGLFDYRLHAHRIDSFFRELQT